MECSKYTHTVTASTRWRVMTCGQEQFHNFIHTLPCTLPPAPGPGPDRVWTIGTMSSSSISWSPLEISHQGYATEHNFYKYLDTAYWFDFQCNEQYEHAQIKISFQYVLEFFIVFFVYFYILDMFFVTFWHF